MLPKVLKRKCWWFQVGGLLTATLGAYTLHLYPKSMGRVFGIFDPSAVFATLFCGGIVIFLLASLIRIAVWIRSLLATDSYRVGDSNPSHTLHE